MQRRGAPAPACRASTASWLGPRRSCCRFSSRSRSCCKSVDQAAQSLDRRNVRFAVNASGPEMALEGGDAQFSLLVIDAADLGAVAIKRQHRLQRADGRPLSAAPQDRPFDNRRRLDPTADAGAPQYVPRKILARIDLARRRDVGMGKHALWLDRVAGADVVDQRDDRGDLRFGERRRAAVMSRIDDFDSNRSRIEVGVPLPGADPGMPGAPRLGDKLYD